MTIKTLFEIPKTPIANEIEELSPMNEKINGVKIAYTNIAQQTIRCQTFNTSFQHSAAHGRDGYTVGATMQINAPCASTLLNGAIIK